MPTESILQDWRYGQTQAERLCAELLVIEGFKGIDPQSPLGGRDGLKDIICNRDGKKWVAACYFPTTRPTFSQIKEKFAHDIMGLAKNNADGISFFVNQPLTPGERAGLTKDAQPKLAEIYHVERIRALLDAPKGYGLRLEYLRVPMTEEEQLGFWSTMKDDLIDHFLNQERSISELHKKMDLLMERTMDIQTDLRTQQSSLSSDKLELSSDFIKFPSASLSIGQLLWIHRLLTDDSGLPEAYKGVFRTVNVWIGKPGSTSDTARFVPSTPDKILEATDTLLKSWRSNYIALVGADQQKILQALAKFHHGFLSIHPFLDANGRVARAILQQQSIEVLNRTVTVKFTADPSVYFECLSQADKGNLDPLTTLISSCLE